MALDSPNLQRMIINGHGEQVTLRRPGRIPIDLPNVWAKIDGSGISGGSQQAPGGVTQFSRRVIISNEEIRQSSWPVPIARGDQIIDSSGKTLTIQAVDVASVGTTIIKYNLNAIGA
jgi:hypothetical protein